VRQGQQNRRGRGRNNNRKGGHHNPLSRSFESNGPDVKIRGTPAHIAEKYLALARDAQSSGDPVLAENYLQHAEHYSRIIMAYREQLSPAGEGMNGNGQRMRGPGEIGEGGEEFGDDEGDDGGIDEGFPQPIMPQQTHQHQPRQNEGGQQHRHDRNFRRDRDRDQGRHRDRFNDRGDRNGDRERNYDRDRPMEGRPQAQDRPPQDQQSGGGGGEGGDFRRRERFPQQAHEQPEFLRRPVRRTRAENGESAPAKDETND
jgi:hypothetical protein